MAALLCLLTCLALFILCGVQSGKKSGLYNVTVTRFGSCADGGTNEIVYHTTLSKPDRNAVCYSGWLSLPYGLTDEINEIWDISSKGSTGGWKSGFLTFRNKHACSDTKRLYPQWFKLIENANHSDTSCPIPKGNYSFTCIDLRDLQFERTSVMIYGTYRLTVKYFLGQSKNRVHLVRRYRLPKDQLDGDERNIKVVSGLSRSNQQNQWEVFISAILDLATPRI